MTDTLPSTAPDPQSSLFGHPPLPSWLTEFRDNQWDVISRIHDAFRDRDVVVLQAPTGAGKSAIAEVSRRLLQTNGVYACTTKSLQDQYLRDFPYARVIKGRRNYLTQAGALDEHGYPIPVTHHVGVGDVPAGESAITCDDCTFSPDKGCNWCMSYSLCPYTVARTRASSADLAVANTSYLLADFRKGGDAKFAHRGLTTVDEADGIEDVILSTIEVDVTPHRQRQLSIQPPFRKTVLDSWITWVEAEAIPKVQRRLDAMGDPSDFSEARQHREYRSVGNLLVKLYELKEGLPRGRWVYDGYDSTEGNRHIIFRPVFVNRYGESMLWQHTEKVLIMSATILSADMLTDDIGLNRPFTFIDVPSTFPVENRPVHIVPIANMVYKEKDRAWPKMVRGIKGVLELHPNERILVHTVSYAFSKYLKAHLKLDPSPPTSLSRRPIITYDNSDGKERALNQYKAHPAAVLLAPSMDRGIDLPDDYCRVQVVAKVPWPNTSDKRINQRMYVANGRAWYTAQAVRTLIQMTGRGVRGPQDHAVTYILDEQFGSNLWKSKHLFPSWWVEAVNWRFPRWKLMGTGS